MGEDCHYYLVSSCLKGSACPFRHCLEAAKTDAICRRWNLGLCRDNLCTLRHIKCSNILCRNDGLPGGCSKVDCTYWHENIKLFSCSPVNTEIATNQSRIVIPPTGAQSGTGHAADKVARPSQLSDSSRDRDLPLPTDIGGGSMRSRLPPGDLRLKLSRPNDVVQKLRSLPNEDLRYRLARKRTRYSASRSRSPVDNKKYIIPTIGDYLKDIEDDDEYDPANPAVTAIPSPNYKKFKKVTKIIRILADGKMIMETHSSDMGASKQNKDVTITSPSVKVYSNSSDYTYTPQHYLETTPYYPQISVPPPAIRIPPPPSNARPHINPHFKGWHEPLEVVGKLLPNELKGAAKELLKLRSQQNDKLYESSEKRPNSKTTLCSSSLVRTSVGNSDFVDNRKYSANKNDCYVSVNVTGNGGDSCAIIISPEAPGIPDISRKRASLSALEHDQSMDKKVAVFKAIDVKLLQSKIDAILDDSITNFGSKKGHNEALPQVDSEDSTNGNVIGGDANRDGTLPSSSLVSSEDILPIENYKKVDILAGVAHSPSPAPFDKMCLDQIACCASLLQSKDDSRDEDVPESDSGLVSEFRLQSIFEDDDLRSDVAQEGSSDGDGDGDERVSPGTKADERDAETLGLPDDDEAGGLDNINAPVIPKVEVVNDSAQFGMSTMSTFRSSNNLKKEIDTLRSNSDHSSEIAASGESLPKFVDVSKLDDLGTMKEKLIRDGILRRQFGLARAAPPAPVVSKDLPPVVVQLPVVDVKIDPEMSLHETLERLNYIASETTVPTTTLSPLRKNDFI